MHFHESCSHIVVDVLQCEAGVGCECWLQRRLEDEKVAHLRVAVKCSSFRVLQCCCLRVRAVLVSVVARERCGVCLFSPLGDGFVCSAGSAAAAAPRAKSKPRSLTDSSRTSSEATRSDTTAIDVGLTCTFGSSIAASSIALLTDGRPDQSGTNSDMPTSHQTNQTTSSRRATRPVRPPSSINVAHAINDRYERNKSKHTVCRRRANGGWIGDETEARSDQHTRTRFE